jgi:hypothetical protein
MLAGQEAETGAAIAVKPLAWARAEYAVTAPSGHSSGVSGFAGGR